MSHSPYLDSLIIANLKFRHSSLRISEEYQKTC